MGVIPLFRGLLGVGEESTKKQAPSTIATEINDTSQGSISAEELDKIAQDNFLESKRFDIDLTDDPKNRKKRDAIEYGILVIGLFEDISNLIAPAVPHALGQMSP